MRIAGLALLGALGLALLPVTAGAVPGGSDRVVAAPASSLVEVRNGCGRGWHWAPGHRGRYGRWHRGQCVPNWR